MFHFPILMLKNYVWINFDGRETFRQTGFDIEWKLAIKIAWNVIIHQGMMLDEIQSALITVWDATEFSRLISLCNGISLILF